MNYKEENKVTERNRINKKLIAIAILFLSFISGFSQTTTHSVFQEWMTSSGTQNTFQRSIVRTRSFGGTLYYYVAGATLNSGYYDIMVSKLSSTGAMLWTQTYSGAGGKDDIATDVQIDAVGNVYVCGTYYKNSTDSNNAIIIKYNSAGTQKWIYTFNGVGSRNDGLTALAVNSNTIYAVGTSWVSSTNKYDFLQLRLDSSGTVVWQNTWNYATANLDEGATNLYSNGGSLYVAGGVQSASTTYKYGVLKIVPGTGVISSTSVTGGTAMGVDKLTDIQQDASGNIYVTGGVMNVSTGYDYKTEKFDSTLTLLWSATYNGAGSLEDIASGLYIDSLNNVIVTGSSKSTSTGKDYATVKYNSSGTQQWAKLFDDTAHGCDSAAAIVTKGTNIYVTGKSYNGKNFDYYTIKYDASGNQIWGIDWNSTPNQNDIATAIAIDTVGGIIVSGQTNGTGTSYYTVKYSERDILVIPDPVVAGTGFDQFVENRGQMRNDSWNSDLTARYYFRGVKPEICMLDNSTTSFIFAHIDKDSTTQDTVVRVDMSYYGSYKVSPKAYGVSNITSSYYMSHIPNGGVAARIHQYNHIIYPEIYSKIDMDFGSTNGGTRCYYIIKPGGNSTSIDIVFTGATSVALSGSSVVVSTAIGNLTLPQAKAFQIDGSGNYVSLSWQPSYSIVSGHVKFTSLGTYNSSQPLVFSIQYGYAAPSITSATGNIITSTFVGGSLDEVFYDVERLTGLYSIGVGSTRSTPFLSTAGSLFQNFYGTTDGFMASYQGSNGNPTSYSIWGGNGEDIFTSVVQDYTNNSNVWFFFAGHTTSSGIPTLSNNGNYIQSTKQGFEDGYIGETDAPNFSNGGWKTYFGGSGNEEINGLSWANNCLYFTGKGNSSSPLKSETHAYNNSTTGTTLVGKFNVNDTIVWSTLFGSGIGKSIDAKGNIISVVGSATSNLPIVTPTGAYSKSSPDSTDAFFARFNAKDTVVWSTYYGGSRNGEDAKGTVVDNNGNLYVTGTTNSSNFKFYYGSNVPYEDSTLSGSRDAFLAQFDSTGRRIWATYFGGQYAEDGTGVDIDYWNDVYFVGFTNSDNMYTRYVNYLYNQSTIGAYTSSISNWGDGYVFMLKPNLQPTWCTYFGGNHVDGIWGVSVKGSTSTAIFGGYAGSNDSTSFPIAGSGAHWTNSGWGNDDAFYTMVNISGIYLTPTAIQESKPFNDMFALYPNPNNGQLMINVGQQGTPQTLMITNTLGQVVYLQNKPETDSNGHISLDLGNLNQGVYFLNLYYGDKSETQKFSIIR